MLGRHAGSILTSASRSQLGTNVQVGNFYLVMNKKLSNVEYCSRLKFCPSLTFFLVNLLLSGSSWSLRCDWGERFEPGIHAIQSAGGRGRVHQHHVPERRQVWRFVRLLDTHHTAVWRQPGKSHYFNESKKLWIAGLSPWEPSKST